ncbi:MAG: M64 family metallo-endopeptidase [Parabacteroides sp.]|nr:M64 family metallo-endopeptidase [Parabacteroides sp.]
MIVTQAQKETLQILSKNEYLVWQPGETLTIAVAKNVEFEATIAADAQSWIKQIVTKGLTTDKLQFEISPNSGEEKRYGEIYLREKKQLLEDTIKIWQEGLLLEVPESLEFGPLCATKTFTVTSSYRDKKTLQPIFSYSVPAEAGSWCVADTTGNEVSVSLIASNESASPRETDITVTSSTVSKKVRITQAPGTGNVYYDDCSYTRLQQATEGKGINLVLMGDGFIHNDLKAGGEYMQALEEAAGYYFTIEPLRSFKEYFNIYLVIAESDEEGVSNASGIKVKNKFGSTFGSGTTISCDLNLCQQYIRLIPELAEIEKLKDVACVLVLNSTKYAGTTSLYSNGFTVAMCPMSNDYPPNDFKGLIHHEACGHGFGLLNDEYYETTPATAIPAGEMETIKKWQQSGFYLNVDSTSNRSKVIWKNFIQGAFIPVDKYAYVGVFEGGATYPKGVWRPEENSCMNHNIPYFNAPSRWAIVKRIMKLAGNTSFTFTDFLRQDSETPPTVVVPPNALPTPTKSTGVYPATRPLGRPQLIEVN